MTYQLKTHRLSVNDEVNIKTVCGIYGKKEKLYKYKAVAENNIRLIWTPKKEDVTCKSCLWLMNTKTRRGKNIPISSAKKIATEYGYDQVIIIARAVGDAEHVTTYGVDKSNCEVAAQCGDFLKYKVMGWVNDEAS